MQPIDLTRISRATSGDHAAELQLLRIFVEQTDETLRSVEAALAAGNFAQIREDAHSIKGASGNVGADRLGELAGSLEAAMKNGEHERAAAMIGEVSRAFDEVRAFLAEHEKRTGV